MSWDYRIVRCRDGWFGLHEVHYDDDDRPTGMNPAYFQVRAEDGPQAIVESLQMALRDAMGRRILREAETWPEEPEKPDEAEMRPDERSK